MITIARDGTGDFNCDGVDDQIQFWQAFDALQNTGGTIYTKVGQYNISYTGLNRWYNNIRFKGDGAGTVLNLGNNASAEMIFATSVSGISIEDMTLNGNKANQSAAGNGIIADSCNDLKIRNVRLLNMYKSGITIQKSYSNTPEDIWIEDCKIDGCNDFGIVATNAIEYHVKGNKVKNSGKGGIQLYACNEFGVTDNTVKVTGQGYGGIRCAETCYGGTIGLNRLVSCQRGVVLTTASNKITVGLNSIYLSTYSGIVVEECAVNTVAHNVCRENGQGGYTEGHGIYLYNFTSGTVNGNVCIDSQGTPTQKYGVLEAGNSDFNTIMGGTYRGNSIANISVSGAHTVYKTAENEPFNMLVN